MHSSSIINLHRGQYNNEYHVRKMFSSHLIKESQEHDNREINGDGNSVATCVRLLCELSMRMISS